MDDKKKLDLDNDVDVMAILDFLRELEGEWHYLGWRKNYKELVQLIAKLEAMLEKEE